MFELGLAGGGDLEMVKRLIAVGALACEL